MKAETQETLQALEKTIEAMGDNEKTTEYTTLMEKGCRDTPKKHNRQQILGTSKRVQIK